MSCPSRARRLPRRPPVRAGALCYKQLNHKNKKSPKGFPVCGGAPCIARTHASDRRPVSNCLEQCTLDTACLLTDDVYARTLAAAHGSLARDERVARRAGRSWRGGRAPAARQRRSATLPPRPQGRRAPEGPEGRAR